MKGAKFLHVKQKKAKENYGNIFDGRICYIGRNDNDSIFR